MTLLPSSDAPLDELTKNGARGDSTGRLVPRRVLPWRFRAAALLLLAQGVLMELAAAVALVVLIALGVEQSTVGEHFRFIVPYLQEHLYLMMGMSGIFGVLRVLGAVGLLRDRMWGLTLSIVNCIVTIALMIFLLPAGIADGILSGGALILILQGWFASRTVTSSLISMDREA